MKLCGLTGGVGMGKSTAAGFFLECGVRMVDTDDLARQLVEPDQPALAEIKNQFGAGILERDGSLNRTEMARLVFSEPAARRKLETILHPRIQERWLAQAEIWRRESCPVAMVVIPLLFETGAEIHFDKVVCVACSPLGQHERLHGRGWSDARISGCMEAQWPADQKITRSHFVVWTEGSLHSHRQQVEAILKKI